MKCAKCPYRTEKQHQMQKHYQNTGHHKEPKKVAYANIAGTKYAKKIKTK